MATTKPFNLLARHVLRLYILRMIYLPASRDYARLTGYRGPVYQAELYTRKGEHLGTAISGDLQTAIEAYQRFYQTAWLEGRATRARWN